MSEHVHEGTGGAELQCHVNIRLVFEAISEVHDVRVREGSVYLNFSVELEEKGSVKKNW